MPRARARDPFVFLDSVSVEEPSIPAHWRLPLVALWISAALHLALIGLVQIRPARLPAAPAPVLLARLEPRLAVVPKPASPPSPPVAPAAPKAPPAETTPANKPVIQPPPAPAAAPQPAPMFSPTPATPSAQVAELPNNPDAEAQPGPSVAVPLLANPVYYAARELDVQPHALEPIQPIYPTGALDRGLSGTVLVELHLEADGAVSKVNIVSADPPGYFEQSALTAFKHARFSAAIRHGEPVRSRIIVKVKYDFDGQGVVKSLGP